MFFEHIQSYSCLSLSLYVVERSKNNNKEMIPPPTAPPIIILFINPVNVFISLF